MSAVTFGLRPSSGSRGSLSLTPPPASAPLPAPEGVPPAPPVAPPPTPQDVPAATPGPEPIIPFPSPPTPHAPLHADVSTDLAHTPDPEPVSQSMPPAPPASHRFPSRHCGGTWQDGPALDRRYTSGQWKTGFTCLLSLPQHALAVASSWAQPPPAVANAGRNCTSCHGIACL